MIPNPCCCKCAIYHDEFAVDSITSGGWIESDGDWSIADGVLSIEDSDALIVAQGVHPDGGAAYQVTRVKVRFDTAGDRAQIVTGYSDDDNYAFAEFWIGADGCGHLQMYSRVSGTSTAIGDEHILPFQIPTGSWTTVSLCLSDELTVRVAGYYGVWAKAIAGSASGDKSGLGTGTVTGTIDFDDFDYLFHYDEEDHPTCPECKINPDCELARDNFNRDDNTDVGCGWEEVAGDWEVEGWGEDPGDDGELTINEPSAIIRHRIQLVNADGDTDGHIAVNFVMRCAAGAIVRVFLDYEDEDNYVAVQIEQGSHGDAGRISFWRNTGGTEEQVSHESVVPGLPADETEIPVRVCWRPDGVVRVSTGLVPQFEGGPLIGSGGSFTAVDVFPLASEPSFALGTGDSGSAQVWFDDVVINRYGDNEAEEYYPIFGGCDSCYVQECSLYVGKYHDADNYLWTVEAGSWSSAHGTLGGAEGASTVTANSDAMLILETGHPMTTADGHLDLTSAANVEFRGSDIYETGVGFGSVVQLILGYEDEDNYLFGEIEFSADEETTGYLRVGKVEGGSRTVLGEEETGAQGGQPTSQFGNHGLQVCYDGYELRAIFRTGDIFPDGTGNTDFYTAGTAGVGWNPGRMGIATGTLTAAVYFYAPDFYHDIFGTHTVGLDPTPICLPCTPQLTCNFCGICEDDELADRTPTVMLLRVSGVEWNRSEPQPFCADLEAFNDVFALPQKGNCLWEGRLGFCAPAGDDADEETEYPRAVVAILSPATTGFNVAGDSAGIPIDHIKVYAAIHGYHPDAEVSLGDWHAHMAWAKRFASPIGRDSIDNDSAWVGFYHPELQNIAALDEAFILREPCDDPPAADDEIPAMNCLAMFTDWHTLVQEDPFPEPLQHTIMIDYGSGPEPFTFDVALWPTYWMTDQSSWLANDRRQTKAEIKVLAA